MQRRGFISAFAALPAVPALLGQQAPPVPAGLAGAGGRGGGAGGRGGGVGTVPRIPMADADEAGVTVARYFTAARFSALRKLSGLLIPALNGNIGALDCDAPEFIDFLISNSPADRQQLYKGGLDGLNADARRQFGKLFADLDKVQADTVLKPLIVPVAWAYDPPKDPMKHFLYQAHLDIRTATRNSLEASKSQAGSGRRGGGAAGLYWHPIDPV